MSRKFTSRLVCLLLATVVLFAAVGSASAQVASKVYWTEWQSYNDDMSRIARADVDGSNVETVLDGFSDGVGCKDLVIDSDAGKLYFANRSAGLIERSNLDGSDRETILAEINPIGLALDVADSMIYWSDYTYNDPCIRRANFDGTDVQTLGNAYTGCSLEGIVLDLSARHVYFAERMNQRIKRCNMDGGGVVTILQCWEGIGHPRGLALANGRIYWSSDENIFSATLSGDDVQPLVSELPDDPYSLEFDAVGGQLYWATGSSYGGMVQRINIDGTGLETLVEELRRSYGLALELERVVAVPDAMPAIVVEHTAWPNPFNPRVTVSFTLAAATGVRLEVFDLHGRRLDTLIEGDLPPGTHQRTWDAAGLSSGQYAYRLVAAGHVYTGKLQLLR